MLTVYALKSCDTCRKALAVLDAAGHEMTVIDVRSDGVPREVLDRLVARAGPEALVNRRSTTWRGLDESTRDAAVDPDRTADVLRENPTLMKRPVIDTGDQIHVGWTPKVRQALTGG